MGNRTEQAFAEIIREAYAIYPEDTKAVLSLICDDESLSRERLPHRKIASQIYEVMRDNLVTYRATILPDDFVDVVAFLFAKAVELKMNLRVRSWYAVDWHGIEHGEWSFWFTCVDLKTNTCLVPEIVRLIEFRKPSDFLHRLDEALTVVRNEMQRNYR